MVKFFQRKADFFDMSFIGRFQKSLLILFIGMVLPFAHAADSHKVLHYVFPSPETGFDPAVAHDMYSSQVIRSIYETLYAYDYLARPAKLVPSTAASMPVVSNHGKTYTIPLKKGIYFTDDSAFGGKKRELTASDYIYSLKRLMDPAVRSTWGWLLEGKVIGLDALAKQARKTGHLDYAKPIRGLELVDRYTFRIHLNKPDYNLTHVLAHYPTSAVAHEIVDKYTDGNGQIMAHPVGTGPYVLTEWQRGSKMILDANPAYRGFIWDFRAGSDPEDKRIVEEMKGKRMPQIGRVEIAVIPEDQSRWLAFENREVDLFNLDGPLAPRALEKGHLRPELASKGIRLSRT